MPSRSPIKIVLEHLSKDDLIDFLEQQSLPTKGNKADLIDRIVRHHDRDLGDIMRRGPWALSFWNDEALENFGVGPRKSFEALAEDLLHAASPAGRLRESVLELAAHMNVAEVREDEDVQQDLCEALGITPRRLAGFLNRQHGRVNIINIADDIVDLRPSEPAPKDGQTEVAAVIPASSSVHVVSEIQRPLIAPGTILANRFQVERALGQGGMGIAYEVVSSRPLGTFVAKFPLTHETGELRNEYDKARLLPRHPNVCAVLGFEHDSVHGEFIVVEHGGASLADRYSGGTNVATAVRIVQGAALGLDFLHQRNVLHGDVNPGNVLIDASGQIRLTDFGISGFLEPASVSDGFTRIATSIRGVHRLFSSVEILRGRPATRASDQWSLAVLLQWLLLGEADFPDAVGTRLPLIAPSSVRNSIDRALYADPGARFPNCSAFASALTGG